MDFTPFGVTAGEAIDDRRFVHLIPITVSSPVAKKKVFRYNDQKDAVESYAESCTAGVLFREDAEIRVQAPTVIHSLAPAEKGHPDRDDDAPVSDHSTPRRRQFYPHHDTKSHRACFGCPHSLDRRATLESLHTWLTRRYVNS